ncbi:MAG: hypothetical protein C0594_12400, partial [Marinilabiliales bacterium]
NLDLIEIPYEIGELYNLRSLNLSVTTVKYLPVSIKNLNALLELILSRNSLTKIPEELIYLQELKYLDLSDNRVTDIPAYIKELKSLEKLNLANNKIETISPEIGELSNLRELNLNNNKIQILPPEIGHLAKLNRLDISQNYLIQLPVEIGNLSSLTYLNLKRNKLKSLPREIGNLTSLKELYLYMNEIKLPDEILQLKLDEIDFMAKFQQKLNEVYIKEAETRQWRNTFIVGFILLLLLVLIFIRSNFIIRKSRKKLERTLAELQETQHKLIEAEKMASLGTLVSRVAHEVNTPVGVGVTTSSTFLNLSKDLKKSYEDKQMTRQQLEEFINDSIEANKLILSNLRNAHTLIQSFKQISVDQVTDELREFNFGAYLYDIINSIQPKLNTKKIKVSIVCQENLIVKSYQGIWSQIVINLALNSLYHGFKNSSDGLIEIKTVVSEDNLQLIVNDNGSGIPDDIISKIFDPFFTTDRKSGTGLGLNILYNLVTQKLKGSVECKNKQDGGIEFRIKAPLKTLRS